MDLFAPHSVMHFASSIILPLTYACVCDMDDVIVSVCLDLDTHLIRST